MKKILKPKIRLIELEDLSKGFLQTLSYLTTVDLSLEKAKEIFKLREILGYKTFVVEYNNFIIGTTTLIIEQKFIHSGGKVGYIEEVVIHPEYRGLKIGHKLVKKAISEAKKLGCYKVILHCAWRNIEYYEKIGFRYNEASMRMDLD